MSSAVRWLVVLLVAAATVLIGASAHAQTSRPCVVPDCSPSSSDGSSVPSTPGSSIPTPSTTAPPTPSTTAPTGGRSAPYTASFSPCTSDGSQSGSAPCDETPQQIQVFYPPGGPPDQVQVNWAADGRSAAAPNPGTTSVTLDYQGEVNDCGTDLACWPWPSAIDDGAFILNGTYQVVVCPFDESHQGNCGNSLPAQSIGLAVPPGAPASVTAHSTGTEVTVAWKAPAQAPPDLVGYSVTRDDSTVYTCSTPDDLGPGAGVRCPSTLEVADHPGDGEYTYTVSALRLGVDSAADDVVSSTATEDSQGVVTVPGPVAGQGGTGSGGQTVPLSNGSGGGAATGTGGATTQVTLDQVSAAAQPAGASAPIPHLSYPTSSDVAPKHPQALALKVDPSTSHNDVVPVAVLALGILSLAIAAHFLYLRVELGAVQAKLAARRASSI